jgi:voltage-gated potassium channel
MDEEDFAALKENYAGRLELRFVRGDYSKEAILRRAGITSASSVIILADTFGDIPTGSLVDDRTILTTLTIKDLKPKIRICAEIVDEEKVDHVRRAGADEIVVQGGMSGFMLARGTSSPELPLVIKTLSDTDSKVKLASKAFPSEMVGMSFEQAMCKFLVDHSSVLVGVFRHEKGFSLESMLADGSAIDVFIRERLKESKENYLTEGKPTSRLLMNPGRDYVIKEDDVAIIIAGCSPTSA